MERHLNVDCLTFSWKRYKLTKTKSNPLKFQVLCYFLFFLQYFFVLENFNKIKKIIRDFTFELLSSSFIIFIEMISRLSGYWMWSSFFSFSILPIYLSWCLQFIEYIELQSILKFQVNLRMSLYRNALKTCKNWKSTWII